MGFSDRLGRQQTLMQKAETTPLLQGGELRSRLASVCVRLQ
jgi:hypothetical protein